MLVSAIELEVFTTLSNQKLDEKELAKSLNFKCRKPKDYFDGLVAMGLLIRDENGYYANETLSD